MNLISKYNSRTEDPPSPSSLKGEGEATFSGSTARSSAPFQLFKPGLSELINYIRQTPLLAYFKERLSRLREGDRPASCEVQRVIGSLESVLIGEIFRSLSNPIMVVVPHMKRSEQLTDDLTLIMGPSCIAHLPFPPAALSIMGHRSPEYLNETTDTLLRLYNKEPFILIASVDCLEARYPDRRWLERNLLTLSAGEDFPRELIITSLAEAGYSRQTLVDTQGQFAIRGGLIDIYPYGMEHPLRIEYDGDRIADIRHFDPSTQRSREKLKSVSFLIGSLPEDASTSLWELLLPHTLVYWADFGEIYRKRVGNVSPDENRVSSLLDEVDTDPPSMGHSPEKIWPQSSRFFSIINRGFPWAYRESGVDFNAKEPLPFSTRLTDLRGYFQNYIDQGYRIFVCADSEGERLRMEELLDEVGIDATLFNPSLTSGFQSEGLRCVLIPTHQLWGRERLRRHHLRFRRRSAPILPESLEVGDLVVHSDYGIGRFEGLQQIKVKGQLQEVMRIRYQDDVILYVSAEHFHKVTRYLGADGISPSLSRIGGNQWAKVKSRTEEELKEMAEELLTLYAQRKIIPGHSFGPDTPWQHEMEASFEFEDTPDQIVATEEIKHDLEAPFPMDRLLCGDVGFGKTEVAIRAAFKVVQESFQVAVLVPTTILAEQHYQTFQSRLSPYPVRIEVLSRFKSPTEQRKILKDLKEGKVDIIIGTHRLLSGDVAFYRLGLLIIDEEHRFGVRHKEKIKQLRANVDVLTMTATPIPRTLHMAMVGVKDTSQLTTPPAFRLPVQTDVVPFSTDLIRSAILFELERGGQVFFVHNWVNSIMGIKRLIERLVPRARVAVGHGQMDERLLEATMFDFMKGKVDVLVCTTIIEAGIDIPNANTLIVNRADRLGMAQLYQLRGRIGRSSRQAYAYFLIPPGGIITSQARRRLQALTEFTPLGSGLQLAMKDLEIRGAGNLLGPQQHGHINAVGFHLYTQLLEETIRKLKGEESGSYALAPEVTIEFSGKALIPSDYVEEGELRYELYTRIARASSVAEVDEIGKEMEDRFGTLPEAVRNLLEGARLKIISRNLRISSIKVSGSLLEVQVKLPERSEEARLYISRILQAAGGEELEFRNDEKMTIIKRFNTSVDLRRARKFLQRLVESQ